MPPLPELRQLRYFVAVAEELHFTRAARRLNIAQPPLSMQIRQLERMLGAPLFLRTSRKVELTSAGIALLGGARRALSEAERAVASTRRAARGEVDTLRVGITDSVALSVLPNLVKRFRREFPTVYLDLRNDSTSAQIEAVRRDLVDVAFVRGPLMESALCVEVVRDEPLFLAAWSAHPLLKRASVRWRDLASVPMVLFPRRLAPSFYDLISTACQRAGFSLHAAYEAAEIETILSYVAAELGVSVVPESTVRLARGGIVYRRLSGPQIIAPVVAVHRRVRASKALEGLLRHARLEKSVG